MDNAPRPPMDRRTFLLGALAAGAAAVIAPRLILPRGAFAADGAAAMDEIVKIHKTDAEWKEILTPAQFAVLRKEDTEAAGSSPLNHEHREGVYRCAGCDLDLFTSDMKYDSGTGWPSFFTVLEGHVETRRDFKLILPRTEYHCARCGGHQGHRFNDGPEPTGLRYCNNGTALKFVPRA